MNKLTQTTLTNPNASKEAIKLMEYLGKISGNAIITGQHTQTTIQAELTHIQKVTGKLPALCGFELLGYSPNVNYENASEECLKEVRENMGTIESALDWALHKKGIVTLTWHWFSPLGGWDKSFYAKNTDFNTEKALIPGTPENTAFLSDMDFMAEKLKVFRDLNIPILWRPFHEADGDWFWWGAKGSEVAKGLWRIMYDRYTKHHQLDNLIWIWNSPKPEDYPGDDIVDIISVDLYPEKRVHTSFKDEYEKLVKITDSSKLTALGEIGTLPGVEELAKTHIPWCWFMIWSNEFCLTEQWSSNEELYKAYNNDYAITLDKLPRIY